MGEWTHKCEAGYIIGEFGDGTTFTSEVPNVAVSDSHNRQPQSDTNANEQQISTIYKHTIILPKTFFKNQQRILTQPSRNIINILQKTSIVTSKKLMLSAYPFQP